MGRKETSVTAASIIAKKIELKNARELTEEQFNQLRNEKHEFFSQGKEKTGKEKYNLLWKTYNILLSGRNFAKVQLYIPH